MIPAIKLAGAAGARQGRTRLDMLTANRSMKEFRRAKTRIEVSVGESVRIVRELQELSQSRLAELTGIPQGTLSAIENGRVNRRVERAKVLLSVIRPCWSSRVGKFRVNLRHNIVKT